MASSSLWWCCVGGGGGGGGGGFLYRQEQQQQQQQQQHRLVSSSSSSPPRVMRSKKGPRAVTQHLRFDVGDVSKTRATTTTTTRALARDDDEEEEEEEEEEENDGEFERRLAAAVEEARDILTEATTRAQNETRRELLETFNRTFYNTRGGKEDEEGEATTTTEQQKLATNIARTQSFLEIKCNMRDFEAARVAKNLALAKSVYEDVEDLMVQVDRLEKALPGVNIGKLLQNDASIVSRVNINKAVKNMMTLYELGFKRDRVPSMLEECPRLLLDETTDVSTRDRIRLVTERIQSIFPDETDEGCLYAIGEEPNLLWALADLDIFNREARVDIAELPMTVQGAFYCPRISASTTYLSTFFFYTFSTRVCTDDDAFLFNYYLHMYVEMVVYATRRFK